MLFCMLQKVQSTINTANFSLKGRIIADRIVIRGSKLNIVSSPEDIDLIYREANIIFSSIEEEYDCSSEHEIYFTAVDKEGEPVSNVKSTINVTGDAVVATNSIVTDENGKATVFISDNKAEMVTLTATTKKGVSESVDILFRDDPVGKVAPLIAEDIVLDEETGFEVVKNQILVVFNENTTEETVKQIANSIGGKIVGYLNGMNDYQLEIPGDNDLDYIKQLITQLNDVKKGYHGDLLAVSKEFAEDVKEVIFQYKDYDEYNE